MKREHSFCGVETWSIETLVVGSGASGYNAMDVLLRAGDRDVALISENLMYGTSRNTGSDKQTYYKLSLSGDEPDSIGMMAADLFAGGAVDGEHALVEASTSAQGFLKLSSLGVPFPKNRFGEYVGYKTDHDPKRRATSAGPYTSKFMTEVLEQSLLQQGAELLGNLQVVRILTDNESARGVLCFHKDDSTFRVIWCRNLIWATGGPAVMYANSVYPPTQFGSSGIAFEAGCVGRNLTEWQYGLASIQPRWNVSGTYMQVLPRFFSVDEAGNEYDFLLEKFQDQYELLSLIFLKGYQWPFDVRKISEGSSIIDLLVYQELEQGRHVYLDYTRNPIEGDLEYNRLNPDAMEYLHRSHADFGIPIDRLKAMNLPAYEFYREHGIDLAVDPLEISLCAQHNNGGLAVDLWWQSSIKGLFAVGEVAGTHGVYRPGGSALNAGQVGSARAADYILHKNHSTDWIPIECSPIQVTEMLELAEQVVGNVDTASEIYRDIRYKMSMNASLIRDAAHIEVLVDEVRTKLDQLPTLHVNSKGHLSFFFRLRDCLLAQLVYLQAMKDYIFHGLASRGSALYLHKDGAQLHPLLPDYFRAFVKTEGAFEEIQEIKLWGKAAQCSWRNVHPIPSEDDFFENVWKGFRENQNVY